MFFNRKYFWIILLKFNNIGLFDINLIDSSIQEKRY